MINFAFWSHWAYHFV